jgi:hypothetical protein
VGALTALIVARPLVAGDDPGRLRLTSGGGTLTLNLLTFVLLLGWAGWRAVSRQKRPLGGPIVLGLFGIGLVTWIAAAGPDRYQHPGWYLGWEWFTVATLFFLIRQLAFTPQVVTGLTAVLLASAVSLSAMTWYQEFARFAGLPSGEPTPTPNPLAPLVGDSEFNLTLNQAPPVRGTAKATFDRPETFTGFLLLVLPVGILAALANWRNGKIGKLTVLVPLVLLTTAALTVPVIEQIPWQQRLEGWQKAWSLGMESFWNGVGPGNFSRRAGLGWFAPENAWLGLFATTGIFALVLAVGCVVYFVVAILRNWRSAPVSSLEESPKRHGPRWEFYYGAIAGSLLGLVLGTGDLAAESNPSDILRLGVLTACRALIWFAAFALLETVPWNTRQLMRCLCAGVVLTAVFGFFSDGLSLIPLNQLFWVTAALALNLRQPVPVFAADLQPKKGLELGYAAIPLALGILVLNIVLVGLPGLKTTSAIRLARQTSREFDAFRGDIEGATGAARIIAVRRAKEYLDTRILSPLRQASAWDPDNSSLLLQEARWSRQHWRYYLELRDAERANQESKKILSLCERAAKCDPYNPAGKLADFEAILMVMTDVTARKERLPGAEKVIADVTAREPWREVQMRWRMVSAFLDQKAWELLPAHAVTLLKLDRVPGAPHGAMTPEQRDRLVERLREAPIKHSQELIELMVVK